MKRLSARSLVALGQTGLVVSILLTAVFFNLVPDRMSAVRDGRAALAEALAANSSGILSGADVGRLRDTLTLVVNRNTDLLSAALRQEEGSALVTVGNHEPFWRDPKGEYSTDTQLQVPIWAGDGKWGHLELRFSDLVAPGWLGTLQHPMLRLTVFLAALSFVAFYFYLGRMLKQLDPKQAIPSRVREALDTMAEGLLVLDHKAQIVLANKSFAAIVEQPPEALMGLSSFDFPWIAEDASPLKKSDAPWMGALREGKAQRNVKVRLQKDQTTWRTFMVNCSPVLGDGVKASGVLLSFDDITDLEEKETELRKSKEEAEAANRAKSEFLAHMSHEIRTPMNSVLGFTEVLKRGYGRTERETRRYLNIITSSGTHLLDLINDILDLSKVEAGRLELERIQCVPHQIVSEVLHIFQEKAKEKGITLEIDAQGSIPEKILTDPGRLRQIVTNLVGNAIKFTSEGGVKVVLRMVWTPPNPLLVLDVIDTGIGMSQDKLSTIFEPFVQADNSITRQFAGTGLGLAISRRFARAMNGDIKVHSQPGKGSSFTVTVDPGPLEGVALLEGPALIAMLEEPEMREQERWIFPGGRVLLVDDGPENRELVALVLREAGLEVETAENGKVGVDKALNTEFDLVLMDVQMPVMDGFTAVGLLRKRGMKVPIIALTANAMKGYEDECIAVGFSHYLTKPIDIDRLLIVLAGLLDGQRALAEAAEPCVDSDGFEDEMSGGDHVASAPIFSRLAHDARFQRIIEKFVQQLKHKLAELEEARQQKDFEQLASIAHWLKGAAGTVGFDAYTEPARELEDSAKQGSGDGVDAAIDVLRDLGTRTVASKPGDSERRSRGKMALADNEAGLRATQTEPKSGDGFVSTVKPAYQHLKAG